MKNKEAWRQLATTFLICLLTFTFSFNAFSQERNERKITLEENERVNGYRIIESDDGKFKIKISGATNPQNGKRLNGTYDLAYRCKLIAGFIVVSVLLAKGIAEREIDCRLKDDPYLYY